MEFKPAVRMALLAHAISFEASCSPADFVLVFLMFRCGMFSERLKVCNRGVLQSDLWNDLFYEVPMV